MLFRRLLSLTVALTFLVVVIGAFVRLTDAGLGCPDWPGCYGHLTSLPETEQEIAAAQAQDPRGTYDAVKASREMLHRYLAGALGLLILALAVLCRTRLGSARLARGTMALLALVVLQALLGMWTVTLQLKPLIVTLHLLGGFATLGLIWWLLLRYHDWPRPTASDPPRPLRYLYAAALAGLVVQITLGGWTSTNYAALACPDFPTCREQWWPSGMDFSEAFVLWRGLGIDYEYGVLDSPARTAIHVAHRIGAVVASALILALAAASIRSGPGAWRTSGWVLIALLAIQVSLGIGNIVLQLPLSVAVAHNAFAAILLLAILTQGRLLLNRGASP
ncbi:MAG: COX15/CtaA family protein [Gammaproteobacteria bacterium]|nr:COX15/CtaA family protein [Gammaproteobacteria bacterium]